MGIITAQQTPIGIAGGDLTGEYPSPTVAENKVSAAKLTEAAQRRLLGLGLPGAAVEHTSATYEIEPSNVKSGFVYIRAVSKSATTCKYNIKVGGTLITEIVDPSITGSLDITVTVYVPLATKLLVEKVEGELEKSFTSIHLMN